MVILLVNIPKAIFYLLKGDYNTRNLSTVVESSTLHRPPPPPDKSHICSPGSRLHETGKGIRFAGTFRVWGLGFRRNPDPHILKHVTQIPSSLPGVLLLSLDCAGEEHAVLHPWLFCNLSVWRHCCHQEMVEGSGSVSVTLRKTRQVHLQ